MRVSKTPEEGSIPSTPAIRKNCAFAHFQTSLKSIAFRLFFLLCDQSKIALRWRFCRNFVVRFLIISKSWNKALLVTPSQLFVFNFKTPYSCGSNRTEVRPCRADRKKIAKDLQFLFFSFFFNKMLFYISFRFCLNCLVISESNMKFAWALFIIFVIKLV